MKKGESAELIGRLYDTVSASLAVDPEKDVTYLTIQNPGRIIDPGEFVDPWSLANPSGSRSATALFSNIVDEIPTLAPIHKARGGKVSDFYRQRLRAILPLGSPRPSEKELQAYKTAMEILYKEIPDKSEATGPKIYASDLHDAYDRNSVDLQNAMFCHTTARRNAMTGAAAAIWPVTAPASLRSVAAADECLRAEGGDRLEAAWNILRMLPPSLGEKVLSDARSLFFGYMLEASSAAVPYSVGSPSNWPSDHAFARWPRWTWNSGQRIEEGKTDAKKYRGLDAFGAGLWLIDSRHSQSDASLDGVSIQFNPLIVAIKRDWLQPHLLGMPGWRVDGVGKGQWSTGSHGGQEGSTFPLLPIAFLAIRDLEIKAEFSKREIDRANRAIDEGKSVAWGPFALASPDLPRVKSFRGSLTRNALTIPNVQILFWINRIVPMCPPE
jgi:hypothetical protein